MSERDPMLPEACATARAELGALLDGELDAAARESVDRHLAGCAACRAELVLLRAVTRAVEALPRPAPPEAMRFRLRAAVAAEVAPGHFEVRRTERRVGNRTEFRVTEIAPGRASSSPGLASGQVTLQVIERQSQKRVGGATLFRRTIRYEERRVAS
jgi:anti-sigma factor RsiW